MNDQQPISLPAKFSDPLVTAKGETRAHVDFVGLQTLWFNTGTLCNIECRNCYIDSSPTNDALVYLTAAEVRGYLDEVTAQGMPKTEIGFTGGEPFMNPDMIEMARDALSRGFRVLILTNAMLPMMRKSVRAGLTELQRDYGDLLTLRISLDHYNAENHDEERGKGTFAKSIEGMIWLRDASIKMAVAGRTMWNESEAEARAGYAALYEQHDFAIDAHSPAQTVLFPEMDMNAPVPEITTACWGILHKNPNDMMCATSRMVVRRRGADAPTVLACTLLAYDAQFEMGQTLSAAQGPVRLNHPHCAKFCVLGGASCST